MCAKILQTLLLFFISIRVLPVIWSQTPDTNFYTALPLYCIEISLLSIFLKLKVSLQRNLINESHKVEGVEQNKYTKVTQDLFCRLYYCTPVNLQHKANYSQALALLLLGASWVSEFQLTNVDKLLININNMLFLAPCHPSGR